MRESNSKRKKTATLTIATKVARRKVICDVANRKIRGDPDAADSYLVYPWLTRHMVNGRIHRLKNQSKKSSIEIVAQDANSIAISSATTVDNSNNTIGGQSNKKYGRSNGSTSQPDEIMVEDENSVAISSATH